MPATIEIPDLLLDQVRTLAQRLDISESRLVEMAVEQFVQHASNPHTSQPHVGVPRTINQGDIYWGRLEDMSEGESIPHPHVILQDNLFNHSRIPTVVVCGLTTNMKRASLPGNVIIDMGEANLAKPSVVEVSKVSTVDKKRLGEYIGTISEQRVNQILAGMRFLQTSYFPR